MNAEDALKLARRFIGLPLEKRRMFLAALDKEGVEFSGFPIPRGVEAEDRQALSYAQQRMWFLWQLEPGSGAYNLPGAVRLKGALSLPALEQAFASLVARHETLRTVFQRQTDDSLLQVPSSTALAIGHKDFSALPAAEREQAVRRAAEAQSMQPFDLSSGPLLRVELLTLDEQEHVLLLTLHHIVSDGWSMNVLIDEFIRCYDAHEAGIAPQLADLPIQYSDYALWQRRWLEAGEQARQLAYWQAQLGDEHPVLELPIDHPRPAMPSYRGTRFEFAVEPALAEQLRTTAQQHNITLFMLLLGAFNVLLHRYTGHTDIRVGVPIANRNRAETEGLIGFFVNTQVLRTELGGQTRVDELLRTVKEAALGAQAHQDLPFERLVEALKLERSLSHTPLFQVMYNHQPQVADIASIRTASGLELSMLQWQSRTTQFDLTLDTWEKAGKLHAALTYANDLFDAATVERMARHWTRLLQGMVADSRALVAELPLLEADEYQCLIHDWNPVGAPFEQGLCIHQMIARQVEATPDALAVIFANTQLSYSELDGRANRLAHKLIELGVGPEVRVGVAMPRSEHLLIALLAVLKAGGAYVPLDPDYPVERVAYMLDDSRARVLLTEQAVAATLSVPAETTVLMLDRIELGQYPLSAPITHVTPDNLAYVIYTSGSTGKPKGVAIVHRNVLALIDWSQSVYSRDDIQGVLASTSVCFDLSVWELFVTLANGGSLIIARNALELPQLPARDQVRLINTVPSAIAALLRSDEIPASVRIINLAGEPLKQSLVDALYQHPTCGSEPVQAEPLEARPVGVGTVGRGTVKVGPVGAKLARDSLLSAGPCVTDPPPSRASFAPTGLAPTGLASTGSDFAGSASTGFAPTGSLPQGIEHVYDLYGPSEDTTYSTWTRRTAGGTANIGRPLKHTASYLLDADLQPVPQGVSAELYLSGAGITRGYLGRAAMTAEKYVPNPFSTTGERLYRTGDLARYQANGNLQYVGRIDHQVKIRGFRIELGEIEARLQQQPQVRELAVLAQDGEHGQQLVAFIVPSDATVLTQVEAQVHVRETLKAALREHLPDYMVPAYLVFLAQLPLTPNGKLDRKALPAIDGSEQQREFVAPDSPLEKALAAIWQDVLNLDSIGLEDNFFELGGDSIVSMQVVSRARQAGIVLNPKSLFQHQTLRSLARVARQGDSHAIDQGLARGAVPLTPVQHWFFERDIPERQHWNQSLLLVPGERLDVVALASALARLVEHHDSLRLRFTQVNGQWQQAYAEPSAASLLWQRQATSVEQLNALCDDAQRSLDLEDGPLLRALLVDMDDDSQRLLLAIHHLVVDGVSWRVLLGDLQAFYGQLQAGQAIQVPAKTSAYRQWAARLHGHLDGFMDSLDYWRAQGTAPAGNGLPCDYPERLLQARDERKVQVRLDAEQTRQLLQQAPKAYRTQVNDLLLTALARTICRWTGQGSTLIQLEGHGREDLFDGVDLTRTVGWFTSLFPVSLSPAPALSASVKAIKEQLRAVPDKGLGYGVLRYLGEPEVRAELAALPAPRITFNYLGQFDRQFDEGALFVPSSEGSGAAQQARAPLANWLTVEGQVYGGELSLNWGFSERMFKHRTIETLAADYLAELGALIEHCCALETPQATPSDFPLACISQAQLDSLPVPAGQLDDLYPLSPMQQGLLFHTLYEQAAGEYINQLRVDIQGIDAQRFADAWQATLDAHEILRSGFVWQGDLEQPLQIVRRQVELPFTTLDWRGRDHLTDALNERADAERRQGFDLAQAPLLRLVLVQTEAERWHLIYTHHHILMDGWSNAQLLGEVLQRYSGRLPKANVGRYRDYIAWLQRQDAQLGETFWTDQLATLQAPTRLARVMSVGEIHSGHGDHFQTLDASRTQALEQFARQQKVTLNTLVQAAWLLLLQRYTGHDSVAFGATVAGRPADLPGIEQQIGLFINTLPVIAAPRPDQSVGAWLQAVQAQNLSLREFEHTPLADIQRWAGQGGEALFDNILVFENYPIAQALAEGAGQGAVFGEVTHLEQTHYSLSVAVTLGQTLTLHYSFDRAHFSPTAIEGISAHLSQLLERFAESAVRNLGQIALVSAEEQAWQQAANSAQPYPTDIAVHQRIADLAAHKPQATAVIFDGQRFSYGEIDRRANQLAHALIARGVGPETRVGVALPRSEGVIVALLAVLKAGGAYVPLDTSYPRERLAYLIEDSGLALLLTDSRVSEKLPLAGAAQVLELDRLDLSLQPTDAPAVRIDPQNLAYVIYTSGSTGNPKGVSVAHGPLAMHCQAIGERYEMRDSDCEFHFMSFAFDGAHERWLTSLTHGASLLIRDDSLWTPEQTYNAMREHGVTVVAFPPVYLQQLAEHAEREGNPPKVRIYCFGGDAVPNASFERVKRALDPDFIINGYGPTETVVTPLIWKAGRDVACGAAYAPIGSRIGDRSAYVLDADLNLLPQGMAGELYLGGTGLARGYLNRPGLTAERFVADPFSACGGLLYRTGDLVRQRADGTFDYLDRIDNQVKIRGFRIELGEVEASLQALEGVREAVVVAQEGAAGSGKRLVAYVVANEAVQKDFAEHLRDQLKATLPAHMVPAYLLLLEYLPLTPNGKLDRKNLPKPDVSQLQQTYVAPRSTLEQQLVSIWQDVLKLAQVGLRDNFFELGGDSIVSIQVVSRARQAGIHFTPKDLFQHQTIEALAAVARLGETSQSVDQGPVTGELTLLPVQRLFFEQAIPQRQHWNQAVMLKPTQGLDARVLEHALNALVVHHDGLRLSFTDAGEGWQARYRSPASHGEDLLWLADVPDAQALANLANAAQRSLDLQDGPLLRAVLATLADGSQRLLLVIHHLVVDGVSWRILFEDLQSAYRQLSSDQALQLPPKTTSARAWAEHLQGYAGSTPLQEELAYWQAQLDGVDGQLPMDNPQGGQQNRLALTVRSRLDASLTRQLLQDAPKAYRTQVNDLLLTALARVMVRWTGTDSALIQLEGHGREALFDDVDLTRTVGWFTSLYPARLTPVADLGHSLKQIKEQLRAIPNKGLGFGVLAHLGDDAARATLARLPIPCLTFNYLGQFDASFNEADGALFVPASETAGDELDAEAPLSNVLALNGQVFGGELNLGWTFSREVFNEATVQALADDYARELQGLIEHCCDDRYCAVTPSDFPLASLDQQQLDGLPMAPAQIADLYPLSPMQQGMLFHAVYGDASGDYINQLRLDVEGLDPQRFRQAWQAAVDAHDILRTRFVWQGDLPGPVQVVSKHLALPYSLHDLRADPQRDQTLQALADGERQQLDLSAPALLRLVIVRLDEQRYHLIYTHHHILMDGWSNSQLLGEVLQRYSGQPVAVHGSRYQDYIAWLQRQDAAASEAFWTPALQRLETPTRLADVMAKPQAAGTGYGDHVQVLDEALTRRLEAFARTSKVTVNTLVQAAWLLLLQRYTGKDTVAFGATVAGRPADLPGIEQQIGLFINTLPVIASPRAEQSLDSWLQTVQAQNLALREFEHTALLDIQRWAGQGGEALFDSLLVFENYPIAQALEQGAPDGLRFGPAATQEQTNYPLTLLVGLDRQLSVHMSYQRASFEPATVVRLATHLAQLLGQMTAHGERCLGELSMLEFDEHQRLTHDWNPVDAPFEQGLCIHQMIARQVEATPDALAVTFANTQLSYSELDGRANRLAHKLIELGVGPEVRVGVAMPRSEHLLIALLAVLKAGGAYVPLDPDYPVERVAYMLDDSRARVLLTEQAVAATLSVPAETTVLMLDQLDLSRYPLSAPHSSVTPDNLAYVIYTSGSTGKPKGVAIAHRNVLALIDWSQSVYSRDDIQGVLASTSVCFDLSVWELFVTLANGGSLIIARNALELPQLPARDQVRLINTVPSAIAALLRSDEIPASVRIINLAGEPLKQSLVDALYQHPTCGSGPVQAEPLEARLVGVGTVGEGTVEIGPMGAKLVGAKLARDSILSAGPCVTDPPPSRASFAPTGLAPTGLASTGSDLAGSASTGFAPTGSLPQGIEHVYDLYGPSEDTTYSTWTRRTVGGTANIGRPLKHTASYLLDADLQPVPQGVSAELYLSGAGITRGYLGRAAMTAEKYVPNPFSTTGERLYRTGDLSRYRADGVLEYLGRIDHQVKIRGFRIELGEIEARLLQQPQVRDVAVLAQDASGAQQLVAYVVVPALNLNATEAQRALRDELKVALREHLPDYMIPAHLLFLEQLPLTPNGKLDRKALPAVETGLLQAGYVAPASELEQQVAAIWSQVLTVERVGLNDHFFELGGHSLLAVNAVSRMALELGLTLTPQLIFQHPVLGEFVAQLDTADGPIDEQKLNKLEALLDEMEEV
ncbi:non-ribosomal peptide synthase/polyketide synthase [Pseudomonas brassicacearum]|uniref:non-ribosomal peptide synthase/polyketide synthase n=1 Tax=Pseudomonas brassicacearum TaxID=930166 RepID=UPI001294901B|nr:non-ribosomal peptide synthase/polyketide synthase [Pseudomonas brassicacearum]QGA51172.1 non-ribosomal peptide synthase/polyketide synthase [Pseudomonas brassicacearum]